MAKVTVLDFRGKVRTMDKKYADILCAIGKAEIVDENEPQRVERDLSEYSNRQMTPRNYETKNQGRRGRGRRG